MGVEHKVRPYIAWKNRPAGSIIPSGLWSHIVTHRLHRAIATMEPAWWEPLHCPSPERFFVRFFDFLFTLTL